MITIVLTYRNREINIVKKCLESLKNQTNSRFKVVLVNYGSSKEYTTSLNNLVKDISFLSTINCDVQNQLWCKSRAINIALKQCETSYFFVGDIDMIYHSNFVETLFNIRNEKETVYFQVGFLSQTESQKNIGFNDYQINFKSTFEATGITLYDTEALKSINGYDEFYNGWGSEDTDIHIRLRNANHEVTFYDDQILVLHQWHSKTYRNTKSNFPFHSSLEKINQKYLEYTKQTQRTMANTKFEWGIYNQDDYNSLNQINIEFDLTNESSNVKGFLNNALLNLENKVVSVSIKSHKDFKSLRDIFKKILGRKKKQFLTMQEINDMMLETIIFNFRDSAYRYTFNQNTQEILLIIKL